MKLGFGVGAIRQKKKFRVSMNAKYGHLCQITTVDSVEDAIRGADIVITVTPSRKPLVMSDCSILKGAKIVVDDWEQASHSGEINVPLSRGLISKNEIWAEIGEIVAGKKVGRTNDEEVTIFVSTGLAIQDAVTAYLVYKRALEKKVGRRLKLI